MARMSFNDVKRVLEDNGYALREFHKKVITKFGGSRYYITKIDHVAPILFYVQDGRDAVKLAKEVQSKNELSMAYCDELFMAHRRKESNEDI